MRVVVDPRTISIVPWDASTLKNIEKAILASDLGITPINDGKSIKLAFPQLTEERRKELKKQTQKMGEEAKVALRNIRRDANEKCKEMKKNSTMTEDDETVEKAYLRINRPDYIKDIDRLPEKEQEIMEI